jgi:alpha-tubulin suppressor-like RCC1 family protein
MIKRYINLTIYILILLTIVIIISRHDIIERYVNITKFGEFMDCGTCDDGSELKGCKGLNSGSCELCRAGTAGKGGECNSCTGKYYTSSTGSLICEECNTDGKKVNSNNTGCDPCPAGTAGTNGICNDCQRGEYQDGTGETNCKECDKGTYQNKKGKSNCNNCPINTYQDEEGRTNCKSCFVKLKDRERDNCEYYENCSGEMKGDCSKGYVFVCGTHSSVYGKNRSRNGLAYYNSSYAGGRYLNSIYTIPFNFGNNYIKQVCCGHHHVVYLNNDNKLYGNGYGVAFGMGDNYYETPIEINAKYAVYNYDEEVWNEYDYDFQIKKISTSLGENTLFLHEDDDVYCCGRDWNSQLGTYHTSNNNLVKIQRYYEYNFDEDENKYIVNEIKPTPRIIDISAGSSMSLFTDNNNNVYISTNMSNSNIKYKNYGKYNYNYGPLLLDKSDLGNGEKKINANFPGYISTNDKIYKFDLSSSKVFEEFYTINNIKNIYSGGYILYVTTTDNNIYSCCVDSRNSGYPYSRLGRTEENVYELVEVINEEKIGGTVKEINISDLSTMILYEDGTVYGCGWNNHGVLSDIINNDSQSYKLKLFNFIGDIKINNICGSDYSIFVRKPE